MSKVILDLNKLGNRGCEVSFSSLYVGLSRVRHGSDIRVFPAIAQQLTGLNSLRNGTTSTTVNINRLGYLLNLKPESSYVTWMSGFDLATGQWSADRVVWSAKQTAARQRKRKKVEKTAKASVGLTQPNAQTLNLRTLTRLNRSREEPGQSHVPMSDMEVQAAQANYDTFRRLASTSSTPQSVVRVPETQSRQPERSMAQHSHNTRLRTSQHSRNEPPTSESAHADVDGPQAMDTSE